MEKHNGMKPSSLMNSMIGIYRQKGMKISDGTDLLNVDSPARLVDSMWEAGNQKSSCLERENNVLITRCLT